MRLDAHFDMLPERAFQRKPGGGILPQGGKGGGSAPSPDPNIGIAQRELAQISREYLQSFQNDVWPELQRIADKQEERADEQFALTRAVQNKQMEVADEQYQRYKDVYRPLQDDIVNQAKAYDTESNREQQAALAIGDTRDQFEQQRQNQSMQMRSFGINPNSGRFQGMMNANNVMEAATSAAAATRARSAAEQLGWAKKMDAIGLGSGVFGNQATSTQLGLAAGSQGMNAGQTGMTNAMSMGNAMNQANMGAIQGWGQVGTLGVQKYNADVNAYQAEQQAGATGSAGLGALLGTLGGAAIKQWSDRRMKKNIELVGHLDDGTNVYSFEYRDEFKDLAGHGTFIGVMADEIELLKPEAVTVMPNGYKAVNYGLVG